MGIGPALAIPKLLEATGLKKEEIGIYEINEAFASQSLYSIRSVGLDMKNINPKGGAIAFGHPLGNNSLKLYFRLHWRSSSCNFIARTQETKEEIRCGIDVYCHWNGSCSFN
jgi:acetyl-CoA acetyltransferase